MGGRSVTKLVFGTMGVVLSTALLSISAYAAPPENPLVQVAAQWAAKWSAGDVEAVMALYAPDAVFLPASGERWAGTDQIRQHLIEALTKFRADISVVSVRSAATGNLGYDSGTYREVIVARAGNDAGVATNVYGNYLFVLARMGDGSWRILEQTWTANRPSKL